MKLVKFLSVVVFAVLLVSSLFAQDKMMDDKKDNKMMKEKDKMIMDNKDKKMEDKMMDNKKMMSSHMMIDKDKNGVAIKGYDPVAYFTDSKAVMGKADYSYKWMDAEWRFASKKNLDMFMKSPEMYAPQYGGYCAYGVAMNHCSSANPLEWKIIDGKLYLYTNNEVEKEWSKDVKESIMKSDEGWIKETAKK